MDVLNSGVLQRLHVKISWFGLGQTLGVGMDSELCMREFLRATRADYFPSNCLDLFLLNISKSRLKTLKELLDHVKHAASLTCQSYLK